MTGGVRCERIDVADLDPATAEEMAEVSRAGLAIDMPSAVPMTGEGLLLQARHGFDDHPCEGLWVARTDEGRVAGHSSLEVSHWDNPDLAMVFCSVHPMARGSGVGTQLLEGQVSAARDLRRSSLLTFSSEYSYPTGFLEAHGFAAGQLTAQRRLHPRHLDYAHVEELANRAGRRAAEYELIQLDGPASEEMLPGLTALFEAINDAPNDGIDREPDTFPVERARRYDAAMAARRQHVYRLLACHRRTGEWAGHTILCVDETRPGYAVQEDTSVLMSHRGHRLGMWLKASMLLWMHDLRPELTAIDTWNARTNTHMIAVNDALGCEVSALGVALQRTI